MNKELNKSTIKRLQVAAMEMTIVWSKTRPQTLKLCCQSKNRKFC